MIAAIKKLKKTKKEDRETGTKSEKASTRTDPREKLAKMSKGIINFATNMDELEHKAREERNNDPNIVTTLQKEREKNSNVAFLSKLKETENDHGELTYGSYIIFNVEHDENDAGDHDENKTFKLTTKFRISDRLGASEMNEDE